MPCSFGVIGYGSASGTRCTLRRTVTSISYPPCARSSARILPVRIIELSCVRCFSVSNVSSGQLALHADALHDPGAVAQLREDDLARLAEVVEPARDLNGLAHMAAGVGNA